MAKVRTTIRMNEDVVKMAKKLGVNISAFTEMKLLEHFKDLENLRRETNNPINSNPHSVSQSNEQIGVHNEASGAYGLVVMTSPSHGGGRRFKSG